MIMEDIKHICALHQWNGIRCVQLFVFPGFWAVLVYRFGHFFTVLKIPVIKQLGLILYIPMKFLVEVLWGISISRKAVIGPGLFINHFSSIFVHSDVVMGSNCVISQEVTLGVKADTHSGAPKIGNDVIIAAGAKVLGKITIGNNAIVGANAVVVKDVQDNWIVGGVPATFIKENSI